MASRSFTTAVEKAFSPAYYQQQWMNFKLASYNYYHPKFRAGSPTPLWHMMIGVSAIMYTTSYLARDYNNIQHKRQIQKDAMREYYEKHGGAPGHH